MMYVYKRRRMIGIQKIKRNRVVFFAGLLVFIQLATLLIPALPTPNVLAASNIDIRCEDKSTQITIGSDDIKRYAKVTCNSGAAIASKGLSAQTRTNTLSISCNTGETPQLAFLKEGGGFDFTAVTGKPLIVYCTSPAGGGGQVAKTSTIPTITQAVSQDNSHYNKASVVDKAQQYMLLRAVKECIDRGHMNTYVDDIEQVLYMDDKQVGEGVGRLAEGDSSNDPDVDCDYLFKATHTALGWDMNVTVCDVWGYTRESGTCRSGDGDWIINKDHDYDDSWYGDEWNKMVRRLWLGDENKSIESSLTNGMRYWIYRMDFVEKCGNDSGHSGFKIFDPRNDDVEDSRHYKNLWWVENKGDKATQKYVQTDDERKGDDLHLSGYQTLGETDGDNNNDVVSCEYAAKKMNEYAAAFNSDMDADAAAGKVVEGTIAEGDAERENTCEQDNGGLAWFGCAILSVMDGIIGFLDGQIRSLLTVQTDKLDESGGLKKAWGVMRNFAYLILVPMMLVMVIGTALGFGAFDPYTVKKALPRMVSAVIFISISYYLCIFLINVSNDVGRGIFNLINLAAPGGAVNGLTDVFGGGSGTLFTGMAAGGALAAAAVGAVTWGILGSFALVTVVALLIGYITLVLRQVLIVMLLVLSPLAILVWIFPGNDKLWGVWKTTFIAMLMMFPLIMILIASGRFFAGTVAASIDGPTGMFMKLIAYIAPYFFIPATFKAGMGAFGVITGAINDRGRGFFDKQRKGREATRAQGWQNFKSGTGVGRFRQSAAVRRVGTSVGAGFQGGLGFGERGAQARSQIAGQAAQEQVMKHPRWSQVQENDDALHALTYGSQKAAVEGLMADRGWDKDRAERAAAAAGASVRYGKSQAIAAAQQLSTTGTGYAAHTDGEGNQVTALEDQIKTIARASGGDKNSAAAIAGYNNFINKQKGRGELAPGAGALIGAVHDNIDGYDTSTADYHDDLTESAWNAQTLYQMGAMGKPASLEEFGTHWSGQYEQALSALEANPNDTEATKKLEKASIAMQEMKSMVSNTSGDGQIALNNALDRMNIARTNHLTGGVAPGQMNVSRGGALASVEKVAKGRARVYQTPNPSEINT